MKTYFNFKSPKTLSILSTVIIALTIGLTACNKHNDDVVTGTASVRAVNSAQASAPQDFYIDDAKQNTFAIAYTQATAYFNINAGAHDTQFRTSGTSTINLSGSVYFNPGSYSTIFFTDDNTGVAIADDPTPPQSNKARVRFINLSSALNTSVDFGLSTGNKIVTNLAYKTVSVYNEVDAATSFSLYAAGSSSAMISIPTTIQAGKIYTIYISGSTLATITYTVLVQN